MLASVSGSDLAAVARVIANPTAAEVLETLLGDRELSVGAIATQIGSPRSTVSESVSALATAGLVTRSRSGRRTLVHLAGHEVAETLEALGRLTRPSSPVGLRAVNRMAALRRARTCYDHVAGELGVRLADTLVARQVLSVDDDGTWHLYESGCRRMIDLGVDPTRLAPAGRRPLVRACLDWTERRPHVAGRLGAAVCALWLETGAIRRVVGGRAVEVAPEANAWLDRV